MRWTMSWPPWLCGPITTWSRTFGEFAGLWRWVCRSVSMWRLVKHIRRVENSLVNLSFIYNFIRKNKVQTKRKMYILILMVEMTYTVQLGFKNFGQRVFATPEKLGGVSWRHVCQSMQRILGTSYELCSDVVCMCHKVLLALLWM